MRKIKFRYRFQNHKTKEIITAVIDLDRLENQSKFNPDVLDFLEWEILSRDEFTGLTDSKDKEIYEADKVKEANVLAGIVEFDKGCFSLKITMSKRMGIDVGQSIPLFDINPKFLLVTGNIYEEVKE